MLNVILLIHIVLCVLAICAGTLVVSDLMSKRLVERRAVWFLRCSLGSNVAALLLEFHHLLLAQKVAMIAVYGTGVAVLAWRKYQLQGAWRNAFAFSMAIILYLNVLALTIQAFDPARTSNHVGPALFGASHALLLFFFLVLGIAAARTFSDQSRRLLTWKSHAVKRTTKPGPVSR